MHLGHARTFWRAFQRARESEGTLILRNDDLDRDRAKKEFVDAFIEDLGWLGIEWQEGPDRGGEYGPYSQSERGSIYRDVFERLRTGGWLFPCICSRKDIAVAVTAPHAADDEPIYPGTCRCLTIDMMPSDRRVSWRFRVPDGETVSFDDAGFGLQHLVAGRDFGDFVVMRHDGVPSYQLACVADDHLMGITEVVRGADLLISTARQILLYRALGWPVPQFLHCPLMTDDAGVRLAKRHAALSLKALKEQGKRPEELRAGW